MSDVKKAGVVGYRVRTNHGKPFRRCGILFTPEEMVVDLAKTPLTDEQQSELMNTPTLDVAELTILPPERKSSAKEKVAAEK